MRLKTIASALVLSSAMIFGGSAFAQTTIAGQAITADDLPKVQERCDQLSLAATTPSLTETKPADDTAGGADATVDDAENTNELANATSKIDLDSVTIEDCAAAGLIKKPM
jgi:hypothetical protein